MLWLTTPLDAQTVVSIPDLTSPAGRTLNVPIEVTDVSGLEIFSFDLTLIYDSNLVTVLNVQTSGTLSEVWGAPTVNLEAGRVQIGFGGTAALSGAGVLIAVRVEVDAEADLGQTTPFILTDFIFNEGSPPVTVTNGSLTVVNDTAPPVITSGPSTSHTTTNAVRINWQTDEPADTHVQYGLDSGYGAEVSDAGFVTNHKMDLTGLKASTTYHYRVSSTDGEGNGPTVSADQVFTTDDILVSISDGTAGPESELSLDVTINDVTHQEVTAINMTIIFDPQLLSAVGLDVNGTVLGQWPAPTFSQSSGVAEISASGPSALTGQGSLFRLRLFISSAASVGMQSVISIPNVRLNDGLPNAQTSAGTLTIEESQPPVIESGPFVAAVTAHSATIEWTTDEDATSRIEYGPTASYGYQLQENGLRQSHRMSLSGLKASTTYHYRIGAVDASGNGPTFSPDQTFTTSAGSDLVIALPDTSAFGASVLDIPIRISNTGARPVFSAAAALTFDPDLLTILEVPQESLSNGWSIDEMTKGPGLVTVNLSGVPPIEQSGVLCNVRFQATPTGLPGQNSPISVLFSRFNRGQLRVETSDGSFTHLGGADQTPPVITAGPFVDMITATSVRISWTTNELSRGYVEYGRQASYGSIVESNQLERNHSIQIGDLSPTTLYHFRVVAEDGQDNGPTTSQDMQFTTNVANAVTVSLPTVSVAPGATFETPVQVTDVTGLDVFSADLTVAFDSRLIEFQEVRSSGTLSESWSSPVFTSSQDQVIVAMGGTEALAGSGRFITLRFRLKPEADLDGTSWIRFAAFSFNEGQPAVTTINGGVTIQDITPPQFTTMPKVSYLDARTAVISWTNDEPATSKIDYGLTSDFGSLRRNEQYKRQNAVSLGNLSPATDYYFQVSLFDRHGNGPTVSAVAVFTTETDGIFGQVVDGHESPISGALVTAISPMGGGSVNSDSSGAFRIDGLNRSIRYEVRASKFAFTETTLSNVPGDSALQITLSPSFAALNGTVSLHDGSAVDSVSIELRNQTTGELALRLLSDDAGRFAFSELVPTTYIISAAKPGFVSNPSQITMAFGPGESRTVDFILERAIIEALEISGPSRVANDQPVQFTATARTSAGRTITAASVEWQLAPPPAGQIQDGRFQPNPEYFGEAQLTVTEMETGLQGNLHLDIYAPLGPQSEKVLVDSAGLELTILSGSVSSGLELQISHPTLNDVQRQVRNYSVVGSGFQLKPDGTTFLRTATLSLTSPASGMGELVIGFWDRSNSSWKAHQTQGGRDNENLFSTEISQLGLYALLLPAQPLGISGIRFRPNPFSPLLDTDGDGKPGLVIEFELFSTESAVPVLTAKVFNMRGQLVRTLVDNRPSRQGKNRVHWDGLTDHGRLARNGRYVIQMSAEDSSGETQHVRTAVLIR